jgi:uncharacterized protein DUF6364
MKQKITLTIQDGLIEKMKIQGVLDKRSVSDITEELYAEFLERRKKEGKKGSSRPTRKHS